MLLLELKIYLAAPTDGSSSSSSSPRISRSSGSDDTAPPAADSSGGLDCYHETHAQRHKLKCFTDQGIDVNFPVYREGDNSGTSQDDQKQNYVNAIITQNPQKMCS
ncbi:hypothetical protein RRG08_049962 [Elysia crispata]|uniref:Uncharacterized protein n=1 Tax=Elysia crispata TaxID=231223 RepID=A0AAE1B2T0_9GAST|nr:hypothetical protein RRG08_049962 [Elysia crispata]